MPAASDKPVVLVFRAPAFNPSEGFVQAQIAGLRRYRPLILALERKGRALPAIEDAIFVPESAADRLRMKLSGPSAALTARLRGEAPALVHAHFAPDGLAALPLARALDIPLVTSLRGYDVTRSRSALLLSGRVSWMRYALGGGRLMRGGDLFLTVSEALRAKAVAAGYPEARVVTHYNGVDLVRFRPDDGKREKIVLHVGRLVEKKGTSVLLQSFAAVAASDPEARLTIVGEGPLRGGLERQAKALNISGRVEFAGMLGAEEVARLMRRAWLLACPSVTAADGDSEGLPNVLVEAAASGLPAVGTRHSGIPEALSDGETGFLVAERDPAALGERIVALLRDPMLAARMGAAARALAEEHFDAGRQAEALERLYDRVRQEPRCG